MPLSPLGIFARPSVSTAFESIATTTVGAGGATDVTFSSIPSTYKHLQIRIIGRNTSTGTGASGVSMQLNSDTGSNYRYHILYGNGTSAAVYAPGSATTEILPMDAVDGSATASVFGLSIIDILDYTNTNKYTTTRSLYGWDKNGSGTIALASGLWMNTAAVNTIKLYSSVNNWAQYTQIALYGIKGA